MSSKETILSKLHRHYTYLRRDLVAGLGHYNNFYRQSTGARIIIYHGICESDHTRFNPIFLTKATFEAHLQFYKKYFNVISLDDFYAARFSNQRFNVCLTFDDGYANNHKYVLPLLEQYQVPASFFLTAIRDAGYDILWNDFLGMVSKYGPARLVYKNDEFIKERHNQYYSRRHGKRLVEILHEGGFEEKGKMIKAFGDIVHYRHRKEDEEYWLQMTPAEIRNLSLSPFVTIGCHGYYHNNMARIDPGAAKQEMQHSKRYLEQLIGKEVKSFAFPYGSYTRMLTDQAREEGFTQLLAMDFLFPEDGLDSSMRERFTVNPFISVNNQMQAIISRKYE